jgi:leader peptidase (prepilin peptidase)/N-methyltransferase
MPIAAAAVFAIGGGAVGYLADRLAARWPAHPDGRVRRLDWRTTLVVLAGTLAFGALALRWWPQPVPLVVLGVYFCALLVLMATDLDQKLLPDVITLPLIPISLVLLAVMQFGLVPDANPLLVDKDQPVVSAILAGIGAPLVLAATNAVFRGALGIGDLKLAAGLGLMSGVTRLFSGVLVASALSSIVILGLLAARKIGLRTAIPFGPILIAGGMLAALAP